MTIVREQVRHVTRIQKRRTSIARGGQGLPGPSGSALTLTEFDASGQMAHRSTNRVTADNVTLTTPSAPADGEQVQFTVEQAHTGFKLAGTSGATVNGNASPEPFPDGPCSGTIQFNAGENNWFITSLYVGQNPA